MNETGEKKMYIIPVDLFKPVDQEIGICLICPLSNRTYGGHHLLLPHLGLLLLLGCLGLE